MASLPGLFNVQNFTDDGVTLVGGRLYTFVNGTTTHKDAFTDVAGAIPHTYTADGLGGLYIALNARGELVAPLYLAAGAYDIALKRADGSSVWTRRADGITLSPSLANFVGTGSQAVFTMASIPFNENAMQIYINGVYQFKNTYSVSGATLTFSEAPPNTSLIEVMFT